MISAPDQSSAARPASESLAARPLQVDVWDLNLDQPSGLAARYASTLDDNEIARTRGFRNPTHAARFGNAHGMMREILAGYLHVQPASLQFKTNVFGKPELADRGTKLAFNLSRSGGRALLAVTHGEEVGVDLEMAHANCDELAIAKRFFSPDERTCLRETPPELRNQVFLRCWTLKEAYIKAVGVGLSLGLDRFDVSPLLRVPQSAKQVIHHDDRRLNRFGFILDAGSPHYAALVLSRDDVHMNLRTFVGAESLPLRQSL